MLRTPWLLIRRHLLAHWVRSGLTMVALAVAMFLFCFLVSLVTTLDSAVSSAATNRVITQSAVSLFVALPMDYQPKIAAVEGVENVTKFQWFGGYYQKPENFLSQFGVDHDVFLDMYRNEIEVVEALAPGGAGSARDDGDRVPLVNGPDAAAAAVAALAADRRACLIGEGLQRSFGWKVGDTVPLIGTIFPRSDGAAWEFVVVGIYRPRKQNMDDRTMFFRYDYLEETLKAGGATGDFGVGVYSVNVAPGHDPERVIAGIDTLFTNGPQVTLTTTEAAFQAGFVSMMGNLPFFVAVIGGAVVFAVVFSVINTMLMAGRQRLHETGILKALGFRDGALVRLMLGESLVLSLVGGGCGVLLAGVTAEPLRTNFLGSFLPTFAVSNDTLVMGLLVSLGIGLIAGITPALMSARLSPTAALRSEG